jgi:hypothetical protein
VTHSLIDLGEVVDLMGIATVSQRNLDAVPEGERENTAGVIKHCAAGDSEITLRPTCTKLVD